MKQPRRPQKEGISEDVEEVDEAQKLWRDAERSSAVVDMLLAGGDRDVADLAVGGSDRQRDLGVVAAK